MLSCNIVFLYLSLWDLTSLGGMFYLSYIYILFVIAIRTQELEVSLPMCARVPSMRHLLAVLWLNFSIAVCGVCGSRRRARTSSVTRGGVFRNYYPSTVKFLNRIDNIFFPYYNFWPTLHQNLSASRKLPCCTIKLTKRNIKFHTQYHIFDYSTV